MLFLFGELMFGEPDVLARALLMGAAWTLNLAVAELIIRGQTLWPIRMSRVIGRVRLNHSPRPNAAHRPTARYVRHWRNPAWCEPPCDHQPSASARSVAQREAVNLAGRLIGSAGEPSVPRLDYW